jgi:outer membrane protein assembly factor BamB
MHDVNRSVSGFRRGRHLRLRSVVAAGLAATLLAACDGLRLPQPTTTASPTTGAAAGSGCGAALQLPPAGEATVWDVATPSGGFQLSSPRAADLNGDGTLDVVVGFGAGESRGGVLALDGRDGTQLWRWDVDAEIYATPTVFDVDGDTVPDVVTGGRLDDIVALSGATGTLLWSMNAANPDAAPSEADTAGTIAIADRTGDGVPELLASRSGGLDSDRPPGELYVIDGATGRQIAVGTTAGGGETYTVPVPLPADAEESGGETPATPELPAVVYGTGGEVEAGVVAAARPVPGKPWTSLWTVTQPAGATRGTIATPTVLDRPGTATGTAFSTFDAVFGRIGDDGDVAWTRRFRNESSYSSPTPQRTRDGVALVVTSYTGTGFPPQPGARGFVRFLDAESGQSIVRRRSARPLVASPVAVDLNGDGDDEIIASASAAPLLERESAGDTALVVYDGCSRQVTAEYVFEGIGSSTPLVTDLDADGTAEIVFAYGRGVAVLRTGAAIPAEPTWPQLFGPQADGVWR